MKYILAPFTAYHDFIYKEICPIVQGRFYDRTESVDLGFEQKNLTPIPEFKHSDLTFTEACAHAAERYKQFSDKEIIVLWSGGIDSSAVVVALLMYTNLDIKISCAESAKIEWPELYKHLKKEPRIKEIIDFKYLSYLIQSRMGADTIWITGEPGDMIFGSKMYRHDQPIPDINGTFDKDLGYKVIRHNLDLWSEPWQGIPDSHREFYQPIVDCCPVPLENNFDLTWWLGFTCKWQNLITRFTIELGVIPPNYTHFFENDEFQQWAMSNNHSVKCPDKNFKKYKHPAKEHIYQYFRDESVWGRFKQDSMHAVHYGIINQYRDIVKEHVKSVNPDMDPTIKIPNLPQWTFWLTEKNMSRKGFGLPDQWVDETWKTGGRRKQRDACFRPSLVEQVIVDNKFPTIETAWEENKKYLDPKYYRDRGSPGGIL